jgi:hypothetical protein
MFYAVREYAEKTSVEIPAVRAYISRSIIISLLHDYIKDIPTSDALNSAHLER